MRELKGWRFLDRCVCGGGGGEGRAGCSMHDLMSGCSPTATFRELVGGGSQGSEPEVWGLWWGGHKVLSQRFRV